MKKNLNFSLALLIICIFGVGCASFIISSGYATSDQLTAAAYASASPANIPIITANSTTSITVTYPINTSTQDLTYTDHTHQYIVLFAQNHDLSHQSATPRFWGAYGGYSAGSNGTLNVPIPAPNAPFAGFYGIGSVSGLPLNYVPGETLEVEIFDEATQKGSGITSYTFSAPQTSATAETPYLGTDFGVNQVITAVDYDKGGEGIGYHNPVPGNARSGSFRSADNIAIQSGGPQGSNIGSTVVGEWLNYSINVPAQGSYYFKASANNVQSGASFHASIENQPGYSTQMPSNASNVTGALAIPQTSGWSTYGTVQSGPFTLYAGHQILHIVLDKAAPNNAVGNLSSFEIVSASSAALPVAPSPSSSLAPVQSGYPVPPTSTSSPVPTDNGGQQVISILDPNLAWSPYNWYFNGSNFAETDPGGGYVKVAFTGPTLGLGIDTSVNQGIPLNSIIVHAYIDGAASPVSASLAQVSHGTLIFTNSLSSGSHFAVIFLSKTSEDYDRWAVPSDAFRVTNIILASNNSTLPLSGISSKKIMIFGDSITEGVGTSQAENAYSAKMAKDLGVEYGQIGYGSLGWLKPGKGGTANFLGAYCTVSSCVNPAGTASALWRNYFQGASRLNNSANLASGFKGGAPDDVFINLGINDLNYNSPLSTLRPGIAQWLSDIRTTIGPSAGIFVIIPFNFGKPNDPASENYKAALYGAVSDYKAATGDSNIFTLDLGVSAYNTVEANSKDFLHPDDYAASILGYDLAQLARPLLK